MPSFNKSTAAFSLLEVMIVLSFLLIISALVLASYPKYAESVRLQNGVQTLATDIRRAQVYGISVKENPVGLGTYPAYGIYFNIPVLGNNKYILFADNNPSDNNYDAGEEVVIRTIVSPGYVYKLCYKKKTDINCLPLPDLTTCCDLDSLDIIFRRPVPDIYLYGQGGTMGPYDDVEMVVKSPKGSVKTLIIWKTGQIAVE